MAPISNWKQDWLEFPKNNEEFAMWKIYLTVWKDALLTPPGLWVNRWLKYNGTPTPENDLNGFFQASINVFMYRDNKLRAVA